MSAVTATGSEFEPMSMVEDPSKFRKLRTKVNGRLFVSYRRADFDTLFARAVYDELAQTFGRKCIFFDEPDMHKARIMFEVLDAEFECRPWLIACVGPQWEPSEYVRYELQKARRMKLLVTIITDSLMSFERACRHLKTSDESLSEEIPLEPWFRAVVAHPVTIAQLSKDVSEIVTSENMRVTFWSRKKRRTLRGLIGLLCAVSVSTAAFGLATVVKPPEALCQVSASCLLADRLENWAFVGSFADPKPPLDDVCGAQFAGSERSSDYLYQADKGAIVVQVVDFGETGNAQSRWVELQTTLRKCGNRVKVETTDRSLKVTGFEQALRTVRVFWTADSKIYGINYQPFDSNFDETIVSRMIAVANGTGS
jgi:hypothetical protein